MEIDLGRLPQLLTAMLMTLAAIILLGPGAPAILVQQAADQAVARLRRRSGR